MVYCHCLLLVFSFAVINSLLAFYSVHGGVTSSFLRRCCPLFFFYFFLSPPPPKVFICSAPYFLLIPLLFTFALLLQRSDWILLIFAIYLSLCLQMKPWSLLSYWSKSPLVVPCARHALMAPSLLSPLNFLFHAQKGHYCSSITQTAPVYAATVASSEI